MQIRLIDISASDRQALTEVVCARVRSGSGPHYREVEPELLRTRCTQLVEAFADSAAGDASAFVAYIRRIAEERLGEGYHLEEIQAVLGILEEQLWQLCERRFAERASLLAALRRTSSIVGLAKDQLACVYLEHKRRADARVDQLQRRIDELFKGTDAVLEQE